MSGSLNSFDEAAFAAALAAAAGLPTSYVALRLSAASVRVEATLTSAPGVGIGAVRSALTALASSTASASLALGVAVENVTMPEVIIDAVQLAPPSAPSQGAASEDGMWIVAVAAAAAVLVALVLVGALLWWVRSRSRRPDATKMPSTSSKVGGESVEV